MPMKNKYVIQRLDEDEVLFWSNEGGWFDLDSADIFTEEETEKVNLPMGGQWIQLKLAKNMLNFDV